MLTTIGLSAKNAILIVQFADEAEKRGATDRSRRRMEAARLRLRPILMTSLAFIAGVFPLAISNGAGAGSQNDIGTGVIGGMLSATILAIFFVPLFFILVRGAVQEGEGGMRVEAHKLPSPLAGQGGPKGRMRGLSTVIKHNRDDLADCRRLGANPSSVCFAATVSRKRRRKQAFAALALACIGAILLTGCVDLAPEVPAPSAADPRDLPRRRRDGRRTIARSSAGATSSPIAKLKTVIEQALANNRDLRDRRWPTSPPPAPSTTSSAPPSFRRSPPVPAPPYASIPAEVAAGGAVPAQGASAYSEHMRTASPRGVSAYQLDLFGKVRNLTRAAQDQYFATQAARDAAQITLVSEVASDYLTLGADRAHA